jgi:peptidyl-prolyl cis-trans isomerase B (cyclophilin B)
LLFLYSYIYFKLFEKGNLMKNLFLSLAVVASLGLSACSDAAQTAAPASTAASAPVSASAVVAASEVTTLAAVTENSASAASASSQNPVVEFVTNQGIIELTLDRAKAPKSVENFMAYAASGFYNGTIFHRVIPNFMVQGGGFDVRMTQKPTEKTVENESSNGLKNYVGTIAMARTSDPQSASSQFFINVNDNDFLNKASAQDGWGYAVFGKVTKGMDVVNKIAVVQTGVQQGMDDVPVKPIIIETTRIKTP